MQVANSTAEALVAVVPAATRLLSALAYPTRICRLGPSSMRPLFSSNFTTIAIKPSVIRHFTLYA